MYNTKLYVDKINLDLIFEISLSELTLKVFFSFILRKIS
jgi:hypothetical protein